MAEKNSKKVSSSKKVTTKKTVSATKKNTGTKKIAKRKLNLKKNILGRYTKQIIIGVIALLAIISISIFVCFKISSIDKTIITIDGVEYQESDFNIYVYLVKYEYFGVDGTELTQNTLNTQVSNSNTQTIGELIKDKALSKIKITSAINKIAKQNNVYIDNEDAVKMNEIKQKFVEELGGEKAFKEMLKKNKTTEEAYDETLKFDILYNKIYDSLYAESKRFDLSPKELNDYTNSYYNDYVKIKQILFLKKDLSTGSYLSDSEINQKELLAMEVYNKARRGIYFDSLIEEYSETYKGTVAPEYYLKTDLLEELSETVRNLRINYVSDVVSTDYAYHIIKREQLDDAYLDKYLDSKREEKLISDISDALNSIAIINDPYLEEITVRAAKE